MSNAQTETHKRHAVEFLKLVVSGKIEEGYKKFVDPNGKHHNCFFPAGFAPLKKAMIENHDKFPAKQYTVKNVVGDGDLVAVHAHLRMNDGDKGMVVVHLCRFRGDKIVEFWDCGQAIPDAMPNSDGAF